MVCHNCGREIKIIGKVMRADVCVFCDADLHCCKSCRLFDPGKNNQCTETQAEYVRDKIKANFCDYFEMNKLVPLNKKVGNNNIDDTRKAFDNLFKGGKTSGGASSDDARSAFDKLFKK